METDSALTALALPARESRLTVFRLLVRNAPEGLTPGGIGEQLDLPAPTLSFHLKTLAQAGQIRSGNAWLRVERRLMGARRRRAPR